VNVSVLDPGRPPLLYVLMPHIQKYQYRVRRGLWDWNDVAVRCWSDVLYYVELIELCLLLACDGCTYVRTIGAEAVLSKFGRCTLRVKLMWVYIDRCEDSEQHSQRFVCT